MPTETLEPHQAETVRAGTIRSAGLATEHPTGNAVGEIRVLGPLELLGKYGPYSLRAHRERVVLAMLALNAGRVVASSVLADAIWGENPPRTSRTQVQICVGAVRRMMRENETPARIVTRHPGYVLETPRCELDYLRFESLMALARERELAGDNEGALRAAASANSLRRGPVLADVHSDVVQRESVILEERGVEAQIRQVRLRLVMGRGAEVIPDLRRLIADHPLREELYASLMLALYRNGRQAEALDAYHQARRTLGEVVGVEPGADLQRLHVAILNQADVLVGT